MPRPSWRRVLGLFALGYGLNIAFHLTSFAYSGILYLDVLGTALAAFALGPWWGATVGALTNITLANIPSVGAMWGVLRSHETWPDRLDALAALPLDGAYLNYTIINVALGLVWGYLGRGRYQLFQAGDGKRQVALRLVMIAALGAIITSIIALLTKNEFHFAVSADSGKEQAYSLFVSLGLSRSANVLTMMPLDLLAQFPDKLVAVSLSAYILFYYLRGARQRLMAGSERRVGERSLVAIGSFLVIYGIAFFEIAFRGNVPPTGSDVPQSVIFWQVVLWCGPLALALWQLAVRLRGDAGPIPAHTPTPERDLVDYEEVYKDLLLLVTTIFAVTINTQFIASEGDVEALAGKGVAVFTFLTTLGVLPLLLRRYLFGEQLVDQESS